MTTPSVRPRAATWLRRVLFASIALAALAGAVLAGAVHLGDRKAQRVVAVAAVPVPLPSSAAALERGRYLFQSRGCTECHAASGAGRAFIDDADMYVKAPNISPGPGSVVTGYGDADWDRAIRHGVKPDGRPLFVMPSEDYNRLSDIDLGALVAYVKQMPPASGSGLQARVPLVVRAMYGAGLIRDAAEKIDHALPPVAAVADDGSAAHGAYVARMCIGCHGEQLEGGKIAGAPPSWPAAARLAPGAGSVMPRYGSAAAFSAMLRSGKRPDGSPIAVMPFESLAQMNDADAAALYRHLSRLPAAAASR